MTTQHTPKVKQEDPLYRSERVALGTFLSDWNEKLTFGEVLQQIQDEDDSDDAPSIWEPFENYDRDDLVSWIENLEEECADLDDPVRIAGPELMAALREILDACHSSLTDREIKEVAVATARAAIVKAAQQP